MYENADRWENIFVSELENKFYIKWITEEIFSSALNVLQITKKTTVYSTILIFSIQTYILHYYG